MCNNKFVKLTLITMLILPIISFVYGQDSPYEFSFNESTSTDSTWGNSEIIELQVNSESRCFFTVEHTWGNFIAGYSNSNLDVYQFGTDNTLTSLSQEEFAADDYPGYIYHRSVVNGLNSLAFPVLSGNVFKWCYGPDDYSNPILFPSSSYIIDGISQIDDTHCLILFRNIDVSGYQIEAYYMDTSANVIWNCSFDLSTIATVFSTFQKVYIVDSTHFVIGMQRSDQFYEIYTLNSTGTVESSNVIQPGEGAYLSNTNVPGRFIVTALQDTSINCYKYENNVSTYLMTVPMSNPPRFVPVVADANCIVIPESQTSSSMCLSKYDWNGNMLWSDNLSITHHNDDNIITRWLKLAPNGSILTALYDRKWGIAGYDSLTNVPYYGWVNYTRVMKIMPDGVTTDITDEVIPQPIEYASVYPNPFNRTVSVDINLSKSSKVECQIYDIKGRKVRTLSVGSKQAGLNTLNWDGKDTSGNVSAPGMYIIRIQTEQSTITRKALKIH